MDGFINLYKPAGLTSFDCVARIRKLLGTKKVGHAGTLDPDATGVLPIAVGKATRLLEYVTAVSKEYRAVMTIGIQTTTQDASGEVVKEINSSHLSKNDIINILPQFIGEIEQIPPMYSAVKVAGKRLYELARKNIEIERQPRKVSIEHIILTNFVPGEYPTATLDVACSKGTYIRTLLEDIGTAMSTTAHMSFLERTRVGIFELAATVTFEEISELLTNSSMDFIMPLDYPLENLGKIEVDSETAIRIKHGNAVPIDNVLLAKNSKINVYRVYNENILIAIARIVERIIKIEKVFQSEGEK